MDAFGQLLLAVGRELGIEGLRADAQGCCRLVFDGQRMLELRAAAAQGRVLLSCRLLGAPPTPEHALLLLGANAWGSGSAGGWFALDDAQQLCLQHALIPAEDGAPELLRQIENMLNAAERWEPRLSAPAGQPTAPAPISPWMQKV
ncbi:type III secretion system chaperone [Comamonas sp. NLF-1-9]|uniref:type III secretion system chaperone n=1 Tax=Comamonas sp. NLF-1-9 TaxID=2853163 RepID=UPI001C470769|nr:type III secretion system chaperone [Comamonas sp. NLF-1-9]QXL83606.1 type III secretion system chaperone [Comamonas sp. NLF-1-9]